jgi:hypothetical protein
MRIHTILSDWMMPRVKKYVVEIHLKLLEENLGHVLIRDVVSFYIVYGNDNIIENSFSSFYRRCREFKQR